MKKILFAICFAILLVGCSEKKDSITEFKYEFGGGWTTTYTYEIKKVDNKYSFKATESLKDSETVLKEISKKDVEKLEDIIKKYEIDKWNGFNDSDNDIMDGTYFSLDVKYDSGSVIKAYGYMKSPDNYQEAHNALVDFLNGLK